LYTKDKTLSCTFCLLLFGSLLKNYGYNFDFILILEWKLKSSGMLHCVDWWTVAVEWLHTPEFLSFQSHCCQNAKSCIVRAFLKQECKCIKLVIITLKFLVWPSDC